MIISFKSPYFERKKRGIDARHILEVLEDDTVSGIVKLILINDREVEVEGKYEEIIEKINEANRKEERLIEDERENRLKKVEE